MNNLRPRANLLVQEVGPIEPEAGGLGKENRSKNCQCPCFRCRFATSPRQEPALHRVGFLCIDIYYFGQHNGPVYSTRFQRPVILTLHALKRMAERIISESELLAVVDTGDTRFKDETHLWAFKPWRGAQTISFAQFWCLKTPLLSKQ